MTLFPVIFKVKAAAGQGYTCAEHPAGLSAIFYKQQGLSGKNGQPLLFMVINLIMPGYASRFLLSLLCLML